MKHQVLKGFIKMTETSLIHGDLNTDINQQSWFVVYDFICLIWIWIERYLFDFQIQNLKIFAYKTDWQWKKMDSNPDLSQQPGSTRLSGRLNPPPEGSVLNPSTKQAHFMYFM